MTEWVDLMALERQERGLDYAWWLMVAETHLRQRGFHHVVSCNLFIPVLSLWWCSDDSMHGQVFHLDKGLGFSQSCDAVLEIQLREGRTTHSFAIWICFTKVPELVAFCCHSFLESAMNCGPGIQSPVPISSPLSCTLMLDSQCLLGESYLTSETTWPLLFQKKHQQHCTTPKLKCMYLDKKVPFFRGSQHFTSSPSRPVRVHSVPSLEGSSCSSSWECRLGCSFTDIPYRFKDPVKPGSLPYWVACLDGFCVINSCKVRSLT